MATDGIGWHSKTSEVFCTEIDGGTLTNGDCAVRQIDQCAHHRERGETVCGNTLRRPVVAVDAAVVDWLKTNVLTEEVIGAALPEVRKRLAAHGEAPQVERDELEAEAKRLRGELGRLVLALASGVELPTIAGVIGAREKRLAEVRARVEVMAVAPSVLDFEVRRLEREARTRLADLQCLLTRNVTEGRKALEALFDGPLRFTPMKTADGRRYLIEGAAAVGSMFTTDSVPKGIRTPVTALKGPCPGPG